MSRAPEADIGPALAPSTAQQTQLQSDPWAEAIAAADAHAPYLARLMRRRSDLCETRGDNWPRDLCARACAEAEHIIANAAPIEQSMSALRRAKDALHLGAAIADLARAWPLERVTGAITDFADVAVRAALAQAVRESVARGDLSADALAAPDKLSGFIVLAMGKMGAGELNYSSDIDFSVFFDPDLMPLGADRDAPVIAVRLVGLMVRMLEEITPDGYVFRTDLRLRPDPGSTRPAVSVAAAENYYQSLGQNWERAAFIKARVVAGDGEAGAAFLDSLKHFMWRKHLDFAAVADVQSIKRQILSTHKSAELGNPVFDVKLGRGGIRDIELFAQTQQLILGGRNPALRVSGTCAALRALANAGAIKADTAETLIRAYGFFRDVEHRIQMRHDEQTHSVPSDQTERTHLAALCGFADLNTFETALVSRRAIVSEIDLKLFGAGDTLAAPEGSLIFTGVDDHPETLATIAKLGFANPETVSQLIRGWHHGRIPAMRSERARELLTALTPVLLRSFGKSAAPDQAFARFADFFRGLRAGVQVLSLLQARPNVMDALARLFGLAPGLAETLSRRPDLLDAMLDGHFSTPLSSDAEGGRLAALRERLSTCGDFEQRLNAARRYRREEAFRIGVQVLEGAASATDAGAAFSDLAEASMRAMADAALKETERLFGPQPGAFTVLALGKFGGRELAEGADLDVMLVFKAPENAVAPGEFYTRLTQRLVQALSAPTEEGALYEIDMALRPSGSKGPVAVRWTSFARYYAEDAWTWEFQALTRLRAVAGDLELGARAEASAREALVRARDRAKTLHDVADMRARLEREKPGAGLWDLKLAPGGLIDVEFIAQALQLVEAPQCPHVLSVNTGVSLARLRDADLLAPDDAATSLRAFALYSDLQQILRLCGIRASGMSEAPPALRARLCASADVSDFKALEAELAATQKSVRALFTRLIGPVGAAPA